MVELLDLEGVYMFKTEEDAQKILNEMVRLAEWYGIVLHSDFKSLIDCDAYPEDYKYGWLEHSIKKARIVPTDRGYFIEFERALPLE